MVELLKYRGRTVSDADAAFLRDLIERNPTASRWTLSRLTCQAWNWTQPNGALRDMVCRGLMLALHRAGHIVLPVQRKVPPNPLAQRSKPQPLTMEAEPVRCALKELLPLTFRQVRRTEQERIFNRAWLYVGHESQVRNPGDFIVSKMGEESVILARGVATVSCFLLYPHSSAFIGGSM